MEIDIKQLKSLMRALRRYDLSEVEIRQGDEEIVALIGFDASIAVAGLDACAEEAQRQIAYGEHDVISFLRACVTDAERDLIHHKLGSLGSPGKNARDGSSRVLVENE